MSNNVSVSKGFVSTPDNLLDIKVIKGNITKIKNRGTKLRLDIHATLVALMDHYVASGTVWDDVLPDLIKAVTSSVGRSQVKAMNQWMVDYVDGLIWDEKNNRVKHQKGKTRAIREIEVKGDDGVVIFSGNARDYGYWNCEELKSTAPVDYAERIEKVIQTALKGTTKNPAIGHADVLRAVLKGGITVEDLVAAIPEYRLAEKSKVERDKPASPVEVAA